MKGTIIGIGLKYGLSGGALNPETTTVRDQVISEGGEVVSVVCLNAAINKRKSIDSGINAEALAALNQVISEGGEVVSFACLNEAISQRKSIAAE